MRGLLVVAVAALAVLAGCVSNGAVNTASTTAEPVAANLTVTQQGVLHTAFGVPLLAGASNMTAALGGEYLINASSTEPTVGVDKAGNVYITGSSKQGSGPTVWMSKDKGQTWKEIRPTLPNGQGVHTSSFDPYVYVDPDTGRVFMDDIWPLGCGMVSFTDDQGASWTTNPISCGNPQVNDHQTLVAAKPRVLTTVLYPKVVYRCVNNVADSACAMSYNGGLTFTPQVPVFTGVEPGGEGGQPNVCGGLTGHLKAGPDGTVYLARGTCGYAEVAVTDNDGATWTTHVINKDHPPSDHEVSLSVDEANNVYAVWPSDGLVWYAYSKDHAKTWSPAQLVTAPGVTATMFNAVGAGAPGKIAIAYLGTTVEGGYKGKPMGSGGLTGDLVGEPDPPQWANATWNAYIAVIPDALNENVTIQTVTANDPANPLARGLCGGTRCHGMNDFIELVVDHEGRPWASFVDVCNAKCATDNATHWDRAIGFVATLQSGPALRGANATLPVIAPPPVLATPKTE